MHTLWPSQRMAAHRRATGPRPCRAAPAPSPAAGGAGGAAAAAASPAATGLAGLRIQPLAPERARQQLGGGDDSGDKGAGGSGDAGVAVPPLEAWGSDPVLMAGCEPGRKLRVAVLVSGGVDSSVALQLVKAAGHEVVGFYLQIWFQEDFRNFWDACPWEEDLGYARQVCESAGVALEVVPMTDQYWDRVVAHSVAEIKAGRTPNPDMLCNSRVKFGAFLEWLEQAQPGRFDRVASGHYARLVRAPAAAAAASEQLKQRQQQQQQQQRQQQQQHDGHHHQQPPAQQQQPQQHPSGGESGGESVRLALTPDAVKDQTYFLAQLSPAQLARTMFPLGCLTKPQVRALAAAAGLTTSGRKDSQGICFLGKVKFGEFVREHLGTWPGPLVEDETGQVVGLHEGYWFYTVGQRGGIKLPGGPWYVVAKDMRLNTVSVSRAYHDPGQRRDAFAAGPFNWLGPQRPARGVGTEPLMVKVRHGPHMAACRLLLGSEAQVAAWAARAAALAPGGGAGGGGGGGGGAWEWRDEDITGGVTGDITDITGDITDITGDSTGDYGLVLLEGNDQGLAAGQYAVLYHGGTCLGAAKILGALGGAAAAASP